jgi:hypothetical protein
LRTFQLSTRSSVIYRAFLWEKKEEEKERKKKAPEKTQDFPKAVWPWTG